MPSRERYSNDARLAIEGAGMLPLKELCERSRVQSDVKLPRHVSNVPPKSL